jgi:hypothetical protein
MNANRLIKRYCQKAYVLLERGTGYQGLRPPNIASTRRRFAACWRRGNALSGSFLLKMLSTQSRRG